MRIVVDLDGTLCANGPHENYATVQPLPGAVEMFNRLVVEGNEVIIHTSRLPVDELITERWMFVHGVMPTQIIYGKPAADLYIDDKATNYLPNQGARLKRKRLVICLSGGMDSYIAYYYAQRELFYDKDDIMCIYFDLGHPYAGKERLALANLGIPYDIIPIGLIQPGFDNTPDEKNYIIPGRNLIFASIAASFGQHVWLMGMKFEDHHLMYDKNSSFFRLASIAASQAVGSPTVVESPFIDKTKTDIIKWAVEEKLPALHATTSCYHPTLLRCGVCSLCVKRAIAMQVAGVFEGGYASDPFKSEEFYRLRDAYRTALIEKDFTHYSLERILETLDLIQED